MALSTLPDSLVYLYALVFFLGMKHGFDADHLATIDGITRFNSVRNPSWAPYCGTLFSLGHGCVVVLIALVVSLFAMQWQPPEWLNALGIATSAFVLATLGLMNLRAALTAPLGHVVSVQGIRSGLLGRWLMVDRPAYVALIGSLFALSFDTVSQAVLFALTANFLGGWVNALILGLIFTLGMLVTDGVNGLWIARLLNKADATAHHVSRIMSIAVGLLSLTLSFFVVAKMFAPSVDAWSESYAGYLSFFILFAILASYYLALRISSVSKTLSSE